MTDELERFRLDDRVALVPGGSGGIGVRVCRALAGVGARVAVVGRDPDRAEAARAAIEDAGSEGLAITGDMTVRRSWSASGAWTSW
jgi:NAD(P)-dependent dehydrogenase (short-subunit alcohol dehydrogenase family)